MPAITHRDLKDYRVKRLQVTTRRGVLLSVACASPREHLRPLLICALDTGFRKSEMLSLRWADVDLEAGLIRARKLDHQDAQSPDSGCHAAFAGRV